MEVLPASSAQEWFASALSAPMVLSAFLATALALFWSRGFRAPVGQPANDGAGAPRSPKDEHNMDTTHGIICYVKRKSIELKDKLSGFVRSKGLVINEYLGAGSVGRVYAGTFKGAPVAVRLMTLPSTPSFAWRMGTMYKLLRHQAGTHPNIVSLLHVEVNPGLQSTNAFGPDWAGCAPPNTTTTSHFKFGSPRPSVEEGQPTSPNRATSLFRLAASAMGPLAGRQSLDERGPEALQREREMRRAAHPARASVDVPSLSRGAWRVTFKRPAGRSLDLHATSSRVREALAPPELVARSTPPRVPPIHENEIYLVTDLCACGSLDELLRQKPGLSWGARALLACDVAEALLHLHTRRVMHADIKLSSCLLVAAPERPELGVRVVLGDAGLAALMDMDESRLSYLRVGPEQLALQSPEALMDGTLGLENDIYQFGCLLWQLACPGQPMFPRGTAGSHALQQLVVCHARPRFTDGVPDAWAALAAQCWAHNPAQRPVARDVLAQVQLLVRQLGGGGGFV